VIRPGLGGRLPMYGFTDPIKTLSRPRVRKKIAVVAALATFVSGLVAPPVQAKTADTGRPEVQSKERVVPGEPLGVKPRKPDPAGGKQAEPAAQASPDAVKITSDAEVRVADRATAERVGVDGVVFSVQTRTDMALNAKGAAGKDGKVAVTLDYSAYADAFGGSFGSRLRLVRLPACALTRPEDPACRTQIPVQADNDSGREKITAEIAAVGEKVSGGAAMTMAAAAGEPGGLAAVSGDSSDKGDYKATKPEPSSQWTVAEQSGDFTWTYPLRVPPVPGELTPVVEIGYSSGSVDGRTSNTNNQPSWVGEGFDYWPGYIKR